MADSVDVIAVRPLDDAPPGRDPSADRQWWEVDLSTDDAFQTVLVWMTGSDATSAIDTGEDNEAWINGEIARMARQYDYELDVLYALSPIELRPPIVQG